MRNYVKNMDENIIDVSEEEKTLLKKNVKPAWQSFTPDIYTTFVTQFNEMINHKQKEQEPITGNFIL